MPKTKTKTATNGPRKAEAKPPAPKPNAKQTGKKKAEQTLPAAPAASQTKKHSTKKEREKAPSAPEPIDHVPTSTASTTPPLKEATTGAEPAPLPPAATADGTHPGPVSVASEAPVAEAAKLTGESRLPPLGTVLQRRDRRGQVLSECVVVEGGGVRYAGTVYASLSAAALAAARDRGRTTSSINGWSYWRLTKPARTAQSRRDPLTLLDAAWVSFRQRVNQLLGEEVPEEARSRVLAQVKEHAKTLERLGASAA